MLLLLHSSKDILYLPAGATSRPSEEGFIRLWTFFIILQVMVPISLYVSIELVKLFQVYFIQEDVGETGPMYPFLFPVKWTTHRPQT